MEQNEWFSYPFAESKDSMDQHYRRQVRNFVSGHLLLSYLDARTITSIIGLEEDVVQRDGGVSGNGRAEYVKPVEQMHQRAHDQLPKLQGQHTEPYHLLGDPKRRTEKREAEKKRAPPFRADCRRTRLAHRRRRRRRWVPARIKNECKPGSGSEWEGESSGTEAVDAAEWTGLYSQIWFPPSFCSK